MLSIHYNLTLEGPGKQKPTKNLNLHKVNERDCVVPKVVLESIHNLGPNMNLNRLFLLSLCLISLASDQFQKVDKALRYIEKNYAYEINDQEITDSALANITNHLDSYSTYLSSSAAEALKRVTRGSFYGIGTKLKYSNNKIFVESVLPNSPASHQDIKAGDEITHVNGIPVIESHGIVQLKDQPKKGFRLTLVRNNKPHIVTIHKAAITLPTVSSQQIDDIGYIKIQLFSKNTPSELFDAITGLSSQTEAILIDLRHNPGGILSSTVVSADYFLNAPNKRSPIVQLRNSVRHEFIPIYASKHDLTFGTPLFILVDENTASGGEIFAKALQHYRRAQVIGRQTFGKGSVQSLIPFEDGSILKLTTASFFGPERQPIETVGVQPDVYLNDTEQMLAQTLHFIKQKLN
tara:strand:- start:6435 stop:7652 length:1218 start_codon:yes stop_codon:yes gene_type:complete